MPAFERSGLAFNCLDEGDPSGWPFVFQHGLGGDVYQPAGISAIQLLDEVSRVTTTTWVTRRPPEFRPGPFTEDRGRAAVALVEDRVRRGLPPKSVVSVTGCP